MQSLFRTWMIPQPDLPRIDIASLRHCLFVDQGYCVVRKFCSLEETREVCRFWNNYAMPPGNKGYWRWRPNYAMLQPRVQRYECMFWNRPEHDLTYEIAWSIQLLRNVIWELPLYSNIFPFDGFACTFRPTRTDAGDSGVSPHTDEMYREDLKHRIQASLAMSTLGIDFEGGGTQLLTRRDILLNIHEHEKIQAGDLILFDQLLEHSVDPVTRSDVNDPLSGHWRLLMPDHPITETSAAVRGRWFESFGKRLLSRLRLLLRLASVS